MPNLLRSAAELRYRQLLGAAISRLLSGFLQLELTSIPPLLSIAAEPRYRQLLRATTLRLSSDCKKNQRGWISAAGKGGAWYLGLSEAVL
jgi:hypothetical protein